MRGRINLNPEMIRPPQRENEFQSYPLAYLLEGGFSSYFTGKPLPEKKTVPPDAGDDTKTGAADETKPEAGRDKKPDERSGSLRRKRQSEENPASVPLPVESEGEFISRGKPGRIFIMASSEMLTDNVIDDQGRGADAVFILNVIDAMNGRENIAVLRGKKQDFNPLKPIGAGAKTAVKTVNIAGLPIMVVLFGVAVWFRRMSRKKSTHPRKCFKDKGSRKNKLAILGVEVRGRQDAKTMKYLNIPSLRNAAGRDASASKI